MILKKQLLILVPIFIAIFVTRLAAQKTDFEGEITYSLNIVSKKKEISNKKLKSFFGDLVITSIKKGNYRQKSLNSTGITDVVYIADDNKWYYKMKGVDTLYFLDGSIEKTKLIGTQKNDTAITILGYKCNFFSMVTSVNKNTFFYADSLYINPAYFTNHLLYYYNIYARETAAVYLKAISENEYYTSTMTAIKIEKKPVDDNIFRLPKLPRAEK